MGFTRPVRWMSWMSLSRKTRTKVSYIIWRLIQEIETVLDQMAKRQATAGRFIEPYETQDEPFYF